MCGVCISRPAFYLLRLLLLFSRLSSRPQGNRSSGYQLHRPARLALRAEGRLTAPRDHRSPVPRQLPAPPPGTRLAGDRHALSQVLLGEGEGGQQVPTGS